MVRNYKRRTMQGRTDAKTMLEAARCVKLHGIPRRQVSREYGIKYRTLSKYIRKFSDEDIYGSHSTPSIAVGYRGTTSQVLSTQLESKLVEYVIKATNVFFGLTTVQIRRMGYELAKSHNVRFPSTWHDSKMAGCDWYAAFMKRHPALQANMSKIMSVSRSSNYGQRKIDMFFTKLQDLMSKCQFKPDSIWDMHECGVSMMDTVANRVVIRGYGHAKSHKGLVTLTATVSADGAGMPPVFIFPTEEVMQRHPVEVPEEDVKPSIIKVSNWMNDRKFLDYLKHFVSFSCCSKTNPCLLIIDHQTYLSIKAIDFAEEHGLVLLSFPQYCSHKLQPLLDQAIYESFSDKMNEACNHWKVQNPKKDWTEEDIQKMVLQNYEQIFVPHLVKLAFRNRGIFPLNKLVLSEVESEEVRNKAAAYGDVDMEEEDEEESGEDDEDDDEDFNMANSIFFENVMSELLIGGLVDQPQEEVI